jgi:DNA modification methylase
VTEGVELIISALQENAYDARIAKMVGAYFHDMSEVLAGLRECLRPRARLCIDIGDSIYAGIHVPTDDLLIEVAEDIGLRTLERVHLRKRLSKGGKPVRQQLLVFENTRRSRSRKQASPPKPSTGPESRGALCDDKWGERSRLKWETFKAKFPHQQQPFAKREWGGPVHSLCSYQGKMKPALAHHLIECFSNRGDVVIDPFSGAGTIPFEARRMGRRGFGIDISRLGHVLTLAKLATPSLPRLLDLLGELKDALDGFVLTEDDIKRAAAVRFNSSVTEYFHPETLREVIAARRFFCDRWDGGPEWAVLFACTLHLLHGNRPYALSRRSHPVTPFKPAGPFEYRAVICRLREKLERVSADILDLKQAGCGSFQADSTALWPCAIPPADAIITSPPFFDSTRFYMTNWMRFWFAGWERLDFETRAEEFLENRQKHDLDIYKKFFEAARERIKSNGVLVLHLGQSRKCDMGKELRARMEPWFVLADAFTESVGHCERHGIRDKGTVRAHTYLVLKPA